MIGSTHNTQILVVHKQAKEGGGPKNKKGDGT
jgi:hypothetical protein